MSWSKPQRLMGDSHQDEDWILPSNKKCVLKENTRTWVPPVKQPKRWGTNLSESRRQWRKPNHNNSKGGKK